MEAIKINNPSTNVTHNEDGTINLTVVDNGKTLQFNSMTYSVSFSVVDKDGNTREATEEEIITLKNKMAVKNV